MSEGELGMFAGVWLWRVGADLTGPLQVSPTVCLRTLARGRNQAAPFGRLLASRLVCVDEMLAHAGQLTAKRAFDRHVLAVQETMELHVSGETARNRRFTASGNRAGVGSFMHPVLAVDAAHGGILGRVYGQVLNRTCDKTARGREADIKESRRWMRTAEGAGSVPDSASTVKVTADIYDAVTRWPEDVHLPLRAGQDRTLVGGGMFVVTAAAWPEKDPARVDVPGRKTRPARAATKALRFGEVSLLRPATANRRAAAAVTLRVVNAAEIDAAVGDFPALVPADDAWGGSPTQTREVIARPRARWTIAQVFHTNKDTTTQIETTQAPEDGRLVKLATVALSAFLRKVQLVTARHGSTGQALSNAAWACYPPMLKAVCAPIEGRTGALRNTHAEDTLTWFALTGARLRGRSRSGPNGRKPPGAPAITHAREQLASIAQGWNLVRSEVV